MPNQNETAAIAESIRQNFGTDVVIESDSEVILPPDAATADDNQNPRRRRAREYGEGAELGVLIETEDRHALENLILHPECVVDIQAGIRAVANRAALESVWGINAIQPQAGRCILNYYGPPGTGKTRAALGVAHRMGKPLYQVDYSAIISKYLGDTAKHLVACFKRAKELDAVLFFDEADSLLSRRVAMGESCATSINQNRNVLMQELDRFNGIVIMTTNLFGNYDPALLRRIARHIKFSLPNRVMRKRLFETHLPTLLTHPERYAVDLDQAARDTQGLSGGDILNVCVNSFHAASMDADSANWKLTQAILISEIQAVRIAKEEHGGDK